MIDVFSHCFPLRRTAKRLSAVSASFPVVHCGIRLLLLLLLCCCSLLGAACSQDSGTSQETAEIAPSNIFSQRPPKQPARTARNILIVGDSLSISLGEQMERVLSGAPGIDFTRDGTRSTGLTRPELLDWPAHLRELVAHMSPDIVVIMQQSPVPQRQNRALCAHPSPAPVRLTEANREAYTNVTVM